MKEKNEDKFFGLDDFDNGLTEAIENLIKLYESRGDELKAISWEKILFVYLMDREKYYKLFLKQ